MVLVARNLGVAWVDLMVTMDVELASVLGLVRSQALSPLF